MSFKINIKSMFTKNKFEAFLNDGTSQSSNVWWDINHIASGNVNKYPNSMYRDKIGSILRKHYKADFDNGYEEWLLTKQS